MSIDKKKKVMNWLHNAVDRVREFAYTEPQAAGPAGRPKDCVAAID